MTTADRSCLNCRAYTVCDRTLRPDDPRIVGLREVEPTCADKMLALANTLARICDQYHETPVDQLPPSIGAAPVAGSGER